MSKKNVSAIVSGAGWISGFWHLMDKEMRRQGWTMEQIHALVTETKPEDQPIAKIVQALRALDAKQLHAFPTTYDCSLGLRKLIELAVGEYNLGNINSDITRERFPLNVADVRTVNLRVEQFLNNETGKQAAKRLTDAGCTLANTGDLAGFQHDHPQEVEKWSWVVALSKDSRWALPCGDVLVPYARVGGTNRSFGLDDFRSRFGSNGGVLVRCESGDTRSL